MKTKYLLSFLSIAVTFWLCITVLDLWQSIQNMLISHAKAHSQLLEADLEKK